MNRRTLSELIDLKEPGWSLVQEWAAEATKPVEFLPVDPDPGAQVLLALQVTTRSPMGAIAYQSGGILVDDGWLHILGAGCERLVGNLLTWNHLTGDTTLRPLPIEPLRGALIIAHDAVGGFFALNGGGLSGPIRSLFYFDPTELGWMDLGIGYSEFLMWAFQGDLDRFYEGCRWPSWREDCRRVPSDLGFHSWPPPWSAEGKTFAVTRQAVPMTELWGYAYQGEGPTD